MEQLVVYSCANVRDLGGHSTPAGPTLAHRFVRCGGTRSLTSADIERLKSWGITRVLDLRGPAESPRITCRLSNQPGITWENVPLYDLDISSPAMVPSSNVDNYLVSSYLQMLAAPHALQKVFAFFAEAKPHECVLFHCAAGMDRTGMIAMLLLGLADVPRKQIIADYARSFASPRKVATELAHYEPGVKVTPKQGFSRYLLHVRIDAIATVYDTLIKTHGSAATFLESCDIPQQTLDAVRAHLVC